MYKPIHISGSNRVSLEFPSSGFPLEGTLGGVLEGTLGEEIGGSLFNSPMSIKEQSESGKEDLRGVLEESLGGVLGESLEGSLEGVLGESLGESLGKVLGQSLEGVLGESLEESLVGAPGENIGSLLNSSSPIIKQFESGKDLGVGGTLSEDLRGYHLDSPPPFNVVSEKGNPVNGPPEPGTPGSPWEGMDAFAKLSQKGSDKKSRNGMFILYTLILCMFILYLYILYM
jgi:hypothetical protein